MKELVFNKIVECHIDINNPETFVVGEIIASDDTYFLMYDINIYGKWNGYALYLLSDLVDLVIDSQYLKKIKKLNCFYNKNAEITDNILYSNNLLLFLFTYVMAEKKVIGIELNMSGDRNIDGVVEDVMDDSVKIHQIDEFGYFDGYSFVRLNSITRCYFGDDESISLERLITFK